MCVMVARSEVYLLSGGLNPGTFPTLIACRAKSGETLHILAGEQQCTEWTEVITDLTEKVRCLETCPRKHAANISRITTEVQSVTNEFGQHNELMRSRPVKILLEGDDSF